MSAPALRAVDVRRLDASDLTWQRIRAGLDPAELPTCTVPDAQQARTAVLSWRWDLDPATSRSRNLALALRHAHETGIDHLFIDVVSVDQALPKDGLLQAVMQLASLFRAIPVIAAYDEATRPRDKRDVERMLDRTMQRPWILSEVRAYCCNPTQVTAVSFRRDDADRRDLSFTNYVSVVRSTGYADCILDVLQGRVGMSDIGDFRLILSPFADLLSACHAHLNRADFLIAVFILAAKYEKHQFVERDGQQVDYGFRTQVADLGLEHYGTQRFTVQSDPTHEAPWETGRLLCLDGQPVAALRSKMTSSFDRNWVLVLPQADARVAAAVGFSPAADEPPASPTSFLLLDRKAPTPSVRERAAYATRGGWMAQAPDPGGTTLGFKADLWK